MIRIDTDSNIILGQKYGLPSQKCGMSGVCVHVRVCTGVRGCGSVYVGVCVRARMYVGVCAWVHARGCVRVCARVHGCPGMCVGVGVCARARVCMCVCV